MTDLEIGGTPTVVRELAVRLHSPPAVEVEVACLGRWGPVAEQIKASGVSVTAFGARGGRDLMSVVGRLRELVRGRGIDTVFSFLVHANFVAALASRKLSGVRFLQSIQTVQPTPRWHWVAQRWARRWAEQVVVPSRAIVDVAAGRSRISPDKFIVIPNAVHPGDFPPVDVFAGPVLRAGYLGRLDPAKSPALLLSALRLSKRSDLELHYFGAGPERPVLEKVVPRAGLVGRVFFHGAVPRPQDALRQIDVLCLPSRVEGFGLVLIEAMASGVPVIACAAGAVPEVVTDRENGLLVDPLVADRQFFELLELLRDDQLRNRLIAAGRRTVHERFTWDVVLPQYRRLIGLSA